MKKILLAVIVLCMTLCSVSAEEIVKINMKQAIDIAIAKNVTYQSKKKDLAIAEKNIGIANRLKNPQFFSHTLIGRVTRSNNSQLGLNIPVEVLKRSARKRVALAEYEKAKTELERYEYNLKVDVMDAYFDILCAKSYYILMQRKERWYKAVLKVAEHKKHSEPRYEINVLRAKTKHERELMNLNYLESNVNRAICNFNKVLNTNERTITYDTVENSLQDNQELLQITLPSYEELEKVALEHNYELKISKDDINIAGKNVTLVKRQLIPDLQLAAGYAYQKMTVHDPYNGAYVSAGVDLPIFYAFRPEIQKAKITLERLQCDRVAYEDILRYTIQDNYNMFNAQKKNMECAKKIYNDMDTILILESRAYERNEIRLMDLMGIEDSQQTYMTEFINCIHEYYRAYLELLRNLGHDIKSTETL
ncbi:MAG: TolC family protein [Candidatus Gastranaerophilales bacterium]|nr:TolC family protein [Candidatus Gastranaerophilales bacterium]